MKLNMPRALCLLLMTVWCSAALAQDDRYYGITSVEVFANSAMVITPQQATDYQLKIYRLDGISQVESMLNQGLPQTEAAARAYAAKNKLALRRKVEPLILDSINGVKLAQHYRLERIPAIVINQRTVVFGVSDVESAIAQYQAFRLQSARK